MASSENKHSPATTPRDPVPVELVLFDYGQVLSKPPDPTVWSRMQAISGLGDAQLHEAYWKFRHDYDRDALNGRAYWDEVARHAGVSLDDTQIRALFAADIDLWTQPNPPMIAWAGALQAGGVRTAVLSNIGDAMAEGIAARLEWLKGFELCIWSYALRLAKPDPEIFHRTVGLLQVAPERILFIDDKEENVTASRRIGIPAIQYLTQVEFEHVMRERGFGLLLDMGTADPAKR
jgi:putative hydrolase of the HAD superfamily